MRYILYSPGYGAGWTSWYHTGNRAQIKFMLEYKPFIDALLAGDELELTEFSDGLGPAFSNTAPACIVKLIPQFKSDWKEAFGEAELPFLGGLRDLDVYEVEDSDLVRITEYDGYESVEVKESFEDEWL